ncbi:hypothetical protein CcaverHIS002_0607320 [Cutaneotrichosporon cavernicola]|uniref:Glycosyl transferase CAP10 domain-containing protein n=1 Tax=Cutaneotrichosporon cavernicola TaxID=279322 RepID=A0AA48QYE3_9TREE|nr:uncharacterized protein CcaverHIS019_0606740 [Cutaneotrichosporon cavernicola]BEI86445.1 hypothetical protein CcaverHIS002_0607320 [Cutaneotrichosporon cavernicola]BEI94215.1 hypothetical protein CcaverHIS019_0606740 [Cutaneotrichosporon cavernicola]BEJ01995.1 hypothetical protein CcaverHIS631_0606770 [Cutaneotrichosporon cavernicola]BEJ09758.1 hypothetical protein CcaverHIS641_0606730 [Cutaneotrichosporon cavernicola]
MNSSPTRAGRTRSNTASQRLARGLIPSHPPEKAADEKRKKRPLSLSLSLSTHSSLSTSTSPPSPKRASFGAAPRHILGRLARARRLVLVPLLVVSLLYFYLYIYEWHQPYDYDPSYLSSYDYVASFFRRPEPPCAFISTVDAFARDLARMREEIGDVPLSHTQARSKGHTFSDTGHLLLSNNPNAPHPIPTLLTLGEEKWASLLAAQSQTLLEAVDEYQRRYGRAPPRGFDKWWDFARAHDVVLPDEYDGIHWDLAPFWALPKDELRRRLKAVEVMDDVFVLELRNGTVFVDIEESGLQWNGTESRARQTTEMLASIAEYLPDLRATFSIFDQPQIYLSWARRDSLVSLGQQGKRTSHLEEVDDGYVRLTRSCAPDSAFRTTPNATSGRSLIYDHTAASDICANPYLAPLHGLTIEPHEPDSYPRPHTQVLPLFSLAKTSLNSDILITPLDQFARPKKDWAWENKRDPRLYWRGSPTGISMMHKGVPWRDSHRWRLHLFANNATGERDVLVPRLTAGSSVGLHTERMDAIARSKWFFNMKLAGEPIQCDQADGTCDEMQEEISWAKFDPPAAARASKFLLDIDGNGWSARFRRLMASNAVVIKTGIFTEWFAPHLVPWFHYVPSKLDFSDLDTIMAFFTGTPGQRLAFDETARALGHNGKCFVQRMFRYADMQAYMLRLFLEYARVIAPDGVDMDLHLHLSDQAGDGDADMDTPEKRSRA